MPDIPKPIRNPEIKYNKLFINNEWVDSLDGSTFETINPATKKVLCSVAEGKEADIDRAVQAAKAAFKRGSEWRQMDASKRGLLLHKIADLIEENIVYLSSLETNNSGRLYTDNILGDLPSVVRLFRYFSGWADKNHGKTIPFDGDFFCYTQHEPIGVCGGLTPWNAPAVMFALKVAPCLAMGNTLVLKPDERTPLTALHLASYFKEVGFPPGVLNVVPGFGKTAGSALSRHMDVRQVAFTGSCFTGKLVMKAAAETNLKRVVLELGGKNPLIIFPDVDVDDAVKRAQQATYNNAGQICASASRTYVHEDIYDEFVEKSAKLAQTKKNGDPFEIDTNICSIISRAQQEKILGMIEACKNEGGKIWCGGNRMDELSGYFIAPTVISNLTDKMTISKEEVFGPVQQIYKFKDLEEVIERANNTNYGLAAGVFSNDLNKVLAVTSAFESGVVWVNSYFPDLSPGMAFGGFKESGIGKDMGEYSLQEYTAVKTVVTRLPRSLAELFEGRRHLH